MSRESVSARRRGNRISLPYQQYLGRRIRATSVGELALVESGYAPAITLPAHRHEHANFCFVLEGGFEETYDHRQRTCSALDLVYRPPGEQHAQRFSPTGGRCFNVEFSTSWVVVHRAPMRALESGLRITGTSVTLISRLYDELRAPDDLTPLSVEALANELVVEAARDLRRTNDALAPPWLSRARELICDRFQESLSLGAVARELGVAPTQLARAFRRAHGCTLAEYQRERRFLFARRVLVDTAWPLSRIASEAGYCDQSHLTRAFRRRLRTTPSAFRAAHRRSPDPNARG
jgi:AraC-like DNA-binding protein